MLKKIINFIRNIVPQNKEKKLLSLYEARETLTKERENVWNSLETLEAAERKLLKEGKESDSHLGKRRIAFQIKQLRDEILRSQAKGRMIGQQIDIVCVQIHNLSLVMQLNNLPHIENVTETAVEAEQLLENLDMGDSNLAVGLYQPLSEEENSILAELGAEVEEINTTEVNKETVLSKPSKIKEKEYA